MMAPEPMQWVKATDNEQLCILVKSFEDHPDTFIDHVASDHGEIQFVAAAFAGNRGLDSASMDTYDVVVFGIVILFVLIIIKTSSFPHRLDLPVR
jgi:hypothetical protein